MKALTEMTMAELVAEFNRRAAVKGVETVGPKAFNSKGKAIQRIEALGEVAEEEPTLTPEQESGDDVPEESKMEPCADCGVNPAKPKSSFCEGCGEDLKEDPKPEATAAVPAPSEVIPTPAQLAAPDEEPVALSSDEVKAKIERAKRPAGLPPIRARAEELLLLDVERAHDAPEGTKPMGLPYATILETIRKEYNSNTSLACLRWYATRMKEEGKHLPERPRGKVVKAEQDVAAATAEGIKADETPKA